MNIETNAFCPECGPDVRTDEEGCCSTCGATATGTAVVALARRLATLESRLAEVERERDEARRQGEKDLRRAIDSELRCTRAMDRYRTERERAFKAEKALVDAHDMLKRAHRIEEAAREVARGDDECHVCLKWGHCPQCTGNRETARRAKCERCELRAALDLPVVVRTCCYRCRQWSEVRARFDDDHRREWLCASCRAALEGGG